jgi:hypothetical protein
MIKKKQTAPMPRSGLLSVMIAVSVERYFDAIRYGLFRRNTHENLYG